MSIINKKTICLNMIVKNEAHIIMETLENIYKYIDYWVICDTGSTDNTKEIITNFFKKKNIKGELYDEPWKNFGHNRSIALEKAYNKSDYVFVFDADDIIEGDFKFPENMDKDCYKLKYGTPGFVYTRTQIVNNRIKWKYRGVLHEYIECINKENLTGETIEGYYFVNSRRLGDRNKDSKKYKKDAKMLLDAIAEETDQTMISRYYFYTGQSFRDYGDYENAIKYYNKRIEFGGWSEELYISYMEIGLAMIKLKYPKDDIIKSFMDGFKILPLRTECLFHLASYYYSINDYNNAYKFAMILTNMKHVDSYSLFVHKDIAQWKAKTLLFDLYVSIIRDNIKIDNISDQEIMINKNNLFKVMMNSDVIPQLNKNIIKNQNGSLHSQKTKEFENYVFYPNLDSLGNDIAYYDDMELEQLKDVADLLDDCVCFNTYGYIKSKANTNMITLPNRYYDCDGLYVKKKYNNLINNKKHNEQKIDGYTFIPNKNIVGNNIKYYPDKTINELKEIADMYDECVGFNTHGYIKYGTLDNLVELKNDHYDVDGIYIKIKQKQNQIQPYDKYNYYNKDLIDKIVKNLKTKQNKKITFTITTCKRYDLFEKTMNSFINCCLDIMMIDEFIGIDDNSSEDDRQKMKVLYPFMKWINKKPEEKGHLNSMNMIIDIVKTEYLLHMEDDWLFYEQTELIKPALEILNQEKIIQIDNIPDDQNINKKIIKQVLFNRNYTEIKERDTMGGYLCKTSTGLPYVIHEHYNSVIDTEKYINTVKKYNGGTCVYWPHYSFRPSILKTDIFKILGKYNKDSSFFERDYANKYYDHGFVSCFLNKVICRHIGKLTFENGDNAYTLNKVAQFDKQTNDISDDIRSNDDFTIDRESKYKMLCLNLERRSDRKDKMIQTFKNSSIDNYEFYKAIDGSKLELTKEIYDLFKGNDFGNRKNVIGCALSHYNIWKELVNSDYDYYIVFEDDIELTSNFKKKLDMVLQNMSKNYNDLVMLGYIMYNNKRKEVYNLYNRDTTDIKITKLNRDLYIGGTFSYLISKNGARNMIKYIEQNGIKHGIDYLFKINNQLNEFETQPSIVFSEWCVDINSPIDSDIQKNYDSFNFDDISDDFIIKNDWTFYKNLDAPGNDIKFVGIKPINELLKIANFDQNCVAFNTLGFLKYEADTTKLITNQYVQGDHGIYIKKDVINKQKNDVIRVKLLCNWTNSKKLCEEWSNMMQSKYKWNNIEFRWDDDVDYYVIINKPLPGDFYKPEKTIIFQMEPWCSDPKQNWGVKTWGEWAYPNPNKFLQVRTHKKYYNNGSWQLKQNWTEFKNNPIIKDDTKGNKISTICSSKYFDPGHIKRIDFLKYVESRNDSDVLIDIYGRDNDHKFKKYFGSLPDDNKDIGITPYKYYFMAENNIEYNYITEKLWEPLLTESLCFYWGCPNVKDYIDPLAYVELDLNDFEKSFNIIKESINNNLWEKRLDIIKKEKQKVLDYYGFCPTLERIIYDDINYDKLRPIMKNYNGEVKHVCFIHSCTINNNTYILDKMIKTINDSGLINILDKIFIINLGNNITNTYQTQKINIINYSSNINLFETPTINLIHAFSTFNQNVKLLYLHTKGASYNAISQKIIDQIDTMLSHLVVKYKNMLEKLDTYDAIGYEYLEKPNKHFNSNFWWSKTNYIVKLHIITSKTRHEPEWWILSNNNVKFLSLHE